MGNSQTTLLCPQEDQSVTARSSEGDVEVYDASRSMHDRTKCTQNTKVVGRVRWCPQEACSELLGKCRRGCNYVGGSCRVLSPQSGKVPICLA
jgi:hypothetical protein